MTIHQWLDRSKISINSCYWDSELSAQAQHSAYKRLYFLTYVNTHSAFKEDTPTENKVQVSYVLRLKSQISMALSLTQAKSVADEGDQQMSFTDF